MSDVLSDTTIVSPIAIQFTEQEQDDFSNTNTATVVASEEQIIAALSASITIGPATPQGNPEVAVLTNAVVGGASIVALTVQSVVLPSGRVWDAHVGGIDTMAISEAPNRIAF